MVSTRSIARQLGIHRSEVRAILDRALAKLAVLLDPAVKPRTFALAHRRQKRCGECGGPGHQRNTCSRRVRS